MYYREFHNHKWALNLSHARRLWQAGQFETLYRGEDLPNGDVYPGLRVITAYWVSVEHEMPLRLQTLLRGSNHPEWMDDPIITQKTSQYLERYLDDMRELIRREEIIAPEKFEVLVQKGLETPANWADSMRTLQQTSEDALAKQQFSEELLETWIISCLRSVANYNRYLIQGGVCAASLVQLEGEAAFKAAVDATAEDFKWEVSRAFFADVMPASGFEDIGDLMELGLRGMYADQYYQSGTEREAGEATIRESILKNCELAGIYQSVAAWEGMSPTALGYGICRYCEAHGEATMMISMPPMVSPAYRRIQSLGIDDKECIFELTTTPANDMERLIMVQEKVFGAVD